MAEIEDCIAAMACFVGGGRCEAQALRNDSRIIMISEISHNNGAPTEKTMVSILILGLPITHAEVFVIVGVRWITIIKELVTKLMNQIDGKFASIGHIRFER